MRDLKLFAKYKLETITATENRVTIIVESQ